MLCYMFGIEERPQAYIFGEVANAKRPINRSLLRFKDSVKDDMARFIIRIANWEEVAEDRYRWRKLYGDGVKAHDGAWLNELARKCACKFQCETIQLHQHSSSQQNQYNLAIVFNNCNHSCNSDIIGYRFVQP